MYYNKHKTNRPYSYLIVPLDSPCVPILESIYGIL